MIQTKLFTKQKQTHKLRERIHGYWWEGVGGGIDWKFEIEYTYYFLFSLFLSKLIFIGVELLYSVVLVSAVQQSESAICIHISPLFYISFPFRSPQSTE